LVKTGSWLVFEPDASFLFFCYDNNSSLTLPSAQREGKRADRTFMYNDQLQKNRRQELRKNQTEAEDILWQNIRNRKINSLKFYRQYGIGPYILDFFCAEVRLAIELDGEQHKDAVEYDQEREGLHEVRGESYLIQEG